MDSYEKEERWCLGGCGLALRAGSNAWWLGWCAECLHETKERRRLYTLGRPSYGTQSDTGF